MKTNKKNGIKDEQSIIDQRKKYFIETIAINKDANMTRIYSVIFPQKLNSENLNQTNHQTT